MYLSISDNKKTTSEFLIVSNNCTTGAHMSLYMTNSASTLAPILNPPPNKSINTRVLSGNIGII